MATVTATPARIPRLTPIKGARQSSGSASPTLLACTPRSSRASCARSAYSHPTRDIRLVETHISWVFLTGDYAYKLKKPVDLGFLDFSTLELRRHFCEEELRLNRRLVPDLYLDVVAIRGSHEAPVVDVNCHAPKHVLEARVSDRAIKGHDVSEADVEILRHQLETMEPGEPKECDLIIDVDTSTDIDLDALVA